MSEKLQQYLDETKDLDALQLVEWGLSTFGKNKIALASSLGAEDQVLTQMILKVDSHARIFTLDTGRQFQENYDVMTASIEKYDFNYEVCFPEVEAVQNLMNRGGPNLFYNSIEDRKACCEVRKMAPLRKKLSTVDCWATGLRSQQSVTRTDTPSVEWDDNFGIFKINPLINWSENSVWDFIKENEIPYNKLHDKGFPSIGCQPCTRAVKEGEDVRGGRWWWETPEQKECGLHMKDGKLVRKSTD
ncbi:MAG: phosphoadenylyl-sulfate reductase [Planctomycetota bacterium]|nr:MAG: phosphoadenylyl-sulfate reductase [Planctomycetota bacterium]